MGANWFLEKTFRFQELVSAARFRAGDETQFTFEILAMLLLATFDTLTTLPLATVTTLQLLPTQLLIPRLTLPYI